MHLFWTFIQRFLFLQIALLFRFQKLDIFFVHNDMGDGWLWVTAHRTGEQGLVFQDLVEDIDESIDPNQVFNWFHDNITKEEAVDMLVKGISFNTFEDLS